MNKKQLKKSATYLLGLTESTLFMCFTSYFNGYPHKLFTTNLAFRATLIPAFWMYVGLTVHASYQRAYGADKSAEDTQPLVEDNDATKKKAWEKAALKKAFIFDAIWGTCAIIATAQLIMFDESIIKTRVASLFLVALSSKLIANRMVDAVESPKLEQYRELGLFAHDLAKAAPGLGIAGIIAGIYFGITALSDPAFATVAGLIMVLPPMKSFVDSKQVSTQRRLSFTSSAA